MRIFSAKIFYSYLGWLIGGLILVMIKTIPGGFENPWFFSFGFLYLIILPGWLIGRLVKFQSFEFSFKILVYFLLGLGFYLILSFLAIFLGLDITILTTIILVLTVVLFISSLVVDSVTDAEPIAGRLDLKRYLCLENLFFLIPLALILYTLWIIYLKQAGLNGDPYFHLSIVNKVLNGESLSMRSLALTKTQTINPTYIYPIWHVFVAFLGKIFAVNIFEVWSNILYGLTMITFLIWYYLGKMIFEQKIWAILVLIMMMVFTLYSGPGYYYTRLGVPDTLGQFILLPLGWIVAFSYIFSKDKENNLLLILNILIAFILLVVHGPHYFYLILSVAIYGIIYALTHFMDGNYKQTLVKIGKVFLADLLILISAGLVIELSSGSLSSAVAGFYKSDGGLKFSTSFLKFGIPFRYSYFLLPILLLFYYKKRILFLISVMLITPIVFWTPLKGIFNKILSGVFTSRVRDNTTLYFIVFAFVFGLILILIDRLLSKLPKKIHQFADAILIALFFLMLILEVSSQTISNFVNLIFYNKPTWVFLNVNSFWFAIGFLLLAVLVYAFRVFEFKKTDLHLRLNATSLIFILILSFGLFTPIIIETKDFLKQPKQKTGEAFFLAGINDDKQGIDFINNQLPSGSTIATTGSASKVLSVLTNHYLAYNPGSAYEKRFDRVFDANNSDSDKIDVVKDPMWTIDYFYLDNPSLQNSHFQLHPELYEKIYNGKSEIYKLVKS